MGVGGDLGDWDWHATPPCAKSTAGSCCGARGAPCSVMAWRTGIGGRGGAPGRTSPLPVVTTVAL